MSSALSLASEPERRPRILALLLTVGETSAPYNEHCLGRHDVALCSLFDPTVSTPAELRVWSGGGSVIGFLRALRQALREGEYDLVHAHSLHVAFLFLVATLLSRRPTPPTVYTLHTSYPNLTLRNRLLLVPVFARFRRIVCCSRSSLELLPPLFRWLGGSRLRAVPNGVDIERVERALARRPRERADGGFDVVVVGRLMELKNPLVILRAFGRLSDAKSRLRFVGTGPLHDAVLEAAAAAGLAPRVELSGLIPREEVYAALASADLYVSASSCEGLPVAALEAMACGRPVLLSDIPPHREIAKGADCVALVALDDVEGFARGLERFRAMSPAARREIGARCRRLVEEHFALGAMRRAYEAVYAEVLHTR